MPVSLYPPASGAAQSTSPETPLSSTSGDGPSRARPRRARTTSTKPSWTVLPPVMSRENSSEDIHLLSPNRQTRSLAMGPGVVSEANTAAGPSRPNRKSSKSVSYAPTPEPTRPPVTRQAAKRASSYLDSHIPDDTIPAVAPRLKRRISTPTLAKQQLAPDGASAVPGPSSPAALKRNVDSRARSTSTSIVLPSTLPPGEAAISWTAPPALPSPPDEVLPRQSGLLESVYSLGESSFRRVADLLGRRPVEVIINLDEESTSSSHSPRSSEESQAHPSYPREPSYFSLPPTPPSDEEDADRIAFARATGHGGLGLALPTPASSRSLSGAHGPRTPHGWLPAVTSRYIVRRGSGKTAQVIRELGWTVGILVGMFFVSLGVALYLLRGLPITQLKHIPSSTTDLQLLSAEIRSYMQSSDAGWYHTIGVVTIVGCWKHAWSVPGAVVLNILVGSILPPIPALALLTFITATGSLFSYLLSRPLAPLIAVLFPKPLALVQAALAPASTPSSSTSFAISAPPSPEAPPRVWRRLLIMRAMGFVPWSGMNVACGVVGVDWRTFWLTTAAGSASWSYVTASVGDILSRLQIPASATATGGLEDELPQGESLTAMLRDPILIGKLVFLTLITLIPVFLKRKSAQPDVEPKETELDLVDLKARITVSLDTPPTSVPGSPPLSPLTTNLARFTPTPGMFDLLSFGRTTLRAGGNVAMSGLREVRAGIGRLGNQ